MYSVILSDTPQIKDASSAILISSHHNRTKPRQKHEKGLKRTEAQFNTKSYSDGLQRAFNKAKQQIYFNSDMKYFITLTYRGKDHSPEQVMHDVKMMIKRENRNRDIAKRGALKYIYIMEYQERGSIHVHMIANDFTTYRNKNGYLSLSYWSHGYSSNLVLTLDDFDHNFKPYLYLFKYMRKAQRIGKSFIHSSRNLNNFHEIKNEEIDPEEWNTVVQERTEHHIVDLHLYFYKYYLKRDIIPPQLNRSQ